MRTEGFAGSIGAGLPVGSLRRISGSGPLFSALWVRGGPIPAGFTRHAGDLPGAPPEGPAACPNADG